MLYSFYLYVIKLEITFRGSIHCMYIHNIPTSLCCSVPSVGSRIAGTCFSSLA